MSENRDAMDFYREQIIESKSLSRGRLLLGFIISFLVGTGGTFVVLYYLSALTPFSAELPILIVYSLDFILGLFAVTILAAIICGLILRYPGIVASLFRLHRFVKRGSGEYFICPEDSPQSLNQVIRRSLYGSLLVAGFALTVLSFNLMVDTHENQILQLGGMVMLASVIILPLTIMQFYFAPWLIKDAGLFHLDKKDRSLSNVGDNLEDILEFVAGIDIILVWIELTLATDWWIAPFIFLIVLGPLFSIVMNFTLVFMSIKERATENMIEVFIKKYEIPDMLKSAEYIRWQVLALIDRRMLAEEFVGAFESKQQIPDLESEDPLAEEMKSVAATASEEMSDPFGVAEDDEPAVDEPEIEAVDPEPDVEETGPDE